MCFSRLGGRERGRDRRGGEGSWDSAVGKLGGEPEDPRSDPEGSSSLRPRVQVRTGFDRHGYIPAQSFLQEGPDGEKKAAWARTWVSQRSRHGSFTLTAPRGGSLSFLFRNSSLHRFLVHTPAFPLLSLRPSLNVASRDSLAFILFIFTVIGFSLDASPAFSASCEHWSI